MIYLKILCLGDVYGSQGCDVVRKLLPTVKKQYDIDLVIANGENSADGNGMIPHSVSHLFDSGVDVITGGNHTFRRPEIYQLLDESERVIRPANFPQSAYGKGVCTVDLGYTKVAVINLIGTTYMDGYDSPFTAADRCIEAAKAAGAKIIIADFHAEATSEKRAMGFYLDGRVSAVFGTHTHVATADACVLPSGTGYITDVGMCGVIDSVLGVDPQIVIERFVTKIPARFKNATGPQAISGCVFSIDKSSGKCDSAEYIFIKE